MVAEDFARLSQRQPRFGLGQRKSKSPGQRHHGHHMVVIRSGVTAPQRALQTVAQQLELLVAKTCKLVPGNGISANSLSFGQELKGAEHPDPQQLIRSIW